jgi:GntR family transcriptional regulator
VIALKVDAKKGLSLTAQLAQQLRHGILAGRLKEGERLPSVRELSAQLRIHPLTIAKAYTSLENEGLASTQWGKGTFVARPSGKKGEASGQYLKELVAKFVDETLPLVQSPRELKALIDEQLRLRSKRA